MDIKRSRQEKGNETTILLQTTLQSSHCSTKNEREREKRYRETRVIVLVQVIQVKETEEGK